MRFQIRIVGFSVLLAQVFTGATARADVRDCAAFLFGRRDSPRATVVETAYRQIVRDRARDPDYRPSWRAFEQGRTTLVEVLDDPAYFWHPANAWNDLLEGNYPAEARRARAWHFDHDVDFPTALELPAASAIDIPRALPALPARAPAAPARDDIVDAWWGFPDDADASRVIDLVPTSGGRIR